MRRGSRQPDDIRPLLEQIAQLKDDVRQAREQVDAARVQGIELAAWHLALLAKTPAERYPPDVKLYAGYIGWVTESNAHYLHNHCNSIARGEPPYDRPDIAGQDSAATDPRRL